MRAASNSREAAFAPGGALHWVRVLATGHDRPKAHNSWVKNWKRHATIERMFPVHRIPLSDPRTSAKGAWLRDLDRLGLEPQLAILERCRNERWRDFELYWTERLIPSGRRLTNGERRSRDAANEKRSSCARRSATAGRSA